VKITIDNLDGAGALDYSSAVCADSPLKIETVADLVEKGRIEYRMEWVGPQVHGLIEEAVRGLRERRRDREPHGAGPLAAEAARPHSRRIPREAAPCSEAGLYGIFLVPDQGSAGLPVYAAMA